MNMPWSEPWLRPETAQGQDSLTTKELEDWRMGKPHQAFEAYLTLLELSGAASVLDIGCGCGYYAEILRSLPVKYCGVDFSEDMIAIARRKYERDGVTFVIGDAAVVPFRGKRFDIVTLGGLIGHLPDWKPVIDEAKRLTRKHLMLHRIRAHRNPDMPTREFTKDCYGVSGAERAFDEERLLGYVGGEVLGEPIRWGANADGAHMLSVLLEF